MGKPRYRFFFGTGEPARICQTYLNTGSSESRCYPKEMNEKFKSHLSKRGVSYYRMKIHEVSSSSRSDSINLIGTVTGRVDNSDTIIRSDYECRLWTP